MVSRTGAGGYSARWIALCHGRREEPRIAIEVAEQRAHGRGPEWLAAACRAPHLAAKLAATERIQTQPLGKGM